MTVDEVKQMSSLHLGVKKGKEVLELIKGLEVPNQIAEIMAYVSCGPQGNADRSYCKTYYTSKSNRVQCSEYRNRSLIDLIRICKNYIDFTEEELFKGLAIFIFKHRFKKGAGVCADIGRFVISGNADQFTVLPSSWSNPTTQLYYKDKEVAVGRGYMRRIDLRSFL